MSPVDAQELRGVDDGHDQVPGTEPGVLERCRAEPTDLNAYLHAAAPVRVTDDGTVLAFDARINTAFLRRAGRTTRVAVSTPGWTLRRVTSMNDAGVIVGFATETGTGRTSGGAAARSVSQSSHRARRSPR